MKMKTFGWAQSLLAILVSCVFTLAAYAEGDSKDNTHMEHPYIFHLIQADLWQAAKASDTVYYPPTYEQDGFTHATANPNLLLNVANHFYPDVPGEWLCLRMTVDSLKQGGIEVVFEGTAPVGDKEPDFPGTDDELFPHILGGIPPSTVLEVHKVTRTEDGRFVSIIDVTD